MNLMFRKNFIEGGSKSGGGGGMKALNTKALNSNRNQNKRSRDQGYGSMDESVHYRTHLFFAPARGVVGQDNEGWTYIYIHIFTPLSLICIYIYMYENATDFSCVIHVLTL